MKQYAFITVGLTLSIRTLPLVSNRRRLIRIDYLTVVKVQDAIHPQT